MPNGIDKWHTGFDRQSGGGRWKLQIERIIRRKMKRKPTTWMNFHINDISSTHIICFIYFRWRSFKSWRSWFLSWFIWHWYLHSPVRVGQLRNKSWKRECILSLNMGWQILAIMCFEFQHGLADISILSLKTHSGFHNLFRFWYV